MPSITIPASGALGILPDVTGVELPPNAWTDANNIRFVNGYAQRASGYSVGLSTPSVAPYAVFSYVTATTRYWVHFGLTSAFSDDGTTTNNITPASPFTGSIDARFAGGVLNGVLVVTNGTDVPYSWAGSGVMTILPGWNATWRCQSITPFKNFLVALDITKGANRYPSMVKWSASAVPGAVPSSWDETNPALDAGEVDLAETSDTLVDALPLGDVLVIYKERSMYAAQLSGDVTNIFRFQRLPGEFGMLAKGCGAVTPVGHVVLTAGDVILHSGGQPRSIVSNKVRDWLFSRIDQSNWRRCFVVANPNVSEVWICFPENGQAACTKALTWNWETDTFGVRSLPNATDAAFGGLVSMTDTWASDSASWESDSTAWGQVAFAATKSTLMLSSTNPALFAMESSNAANGSNISATLERKHMPLGGDTNIVKVVKSIRPRIDASAGTVVNIEVGSSMDPEQEPVYSAPVPYTVGTTFQADTFSSGRFHSIRFSSDGISPWRIKSFDIEFVTRGKW